MQPSIETLSTIQTRKPKRRTRTHSDAHVRNVTFKRAPRQSPTSAGHPANWDDVSNELLEDALVQAEYAVKLDQHIEKCSTQERTRKRAIRAYQQTKESLVAVIEYQKGSLKSATRRKQDEAIQLALRLVEEYTARIETLKSESDDPEYEFEEVEVDEDEDEDDEDEDEDEDVEMDDGEETVTSNTPRFGQMEL